MKNRAELTINHNNIPLLNPLLPQHPCKSLYLTQQLRIANALLDACHRAVIQNSRTITVAGLDVAVHAVVARRDLTVGEPRPRVVRHTRFLQPLLGQLQNPRRLAVPVQVVGLVRPEGFWIGE
jgi:hypothetical protein